MADITLVRLDEEAIDPRDAAAARRVLFGQIDGLGEGERRKWRRFINGLFRLTPGEIIEIKTRKARSSPFHRRHMLIEQRVFEAQERFESFKTFRDWLKVGSGFVDWFPGAEQPIAVPRSISFESIEDDEMREVHDDMVAFLRTAHAGAALWPHLSATQRIEMIETVLREFDE